MRRHKLLDKKNEPQVLPDVATEPHPEASVEPEWVLPAKDLLETRPPGKLPTPLDPASPEARGWPLDPKIEPDSDDGSDCHEPAGGCQKRTP